MPVNRNALIRYNTIDNCLRNRQRLWTLEDLIETCSDALYEFEGIDKGVSRRTIQMDIQMMRSEKLGYNAPIVVTEKKYYSYEDPDYSITNIPLTDQDLGKLGEVVEILRQFKGFTHFKELTGMVQKLEDKIHTSKTKERSIIDLEKNENLKGLEFIDPLYQAILAKKCVSITYQSFKARSANTFTFHPYLLKEHRNRWFVMGCPKKQENYLMLALDRIHDLSTLEENSRAIDETELEGFFDDVIGVTVNKGQQPEEIVLMATKDNAPYILTKPLHHSQKTIGNTQSGVLISLEVQHNFELERDILALGDKIKVISPPRLRRVIRERLANAIEKYDTELDPKRLKTYPISLEKSGSLILNSIYTTKEMTSIGRLINTYFEATGLQKSECYSLRELFLQIPDLPKLCINDNLVQLLNEFDKSLFLTKAIFFDKPAKGNWFVGWHQDLPINVKAKEEVDGYTAWTNKEGVISCVPPVEISKNTVAVRIHLDEANTDNGCLRVIHGTHNKKLNPTEIKTITENAMAHDCKVAKGGIHLMTPLILHASSKSTNQKPRRVVHLEFSSKELASPLEWSERLKF